MHCLTIAISVRAVRYIGRPMECCALIPLLILYTLCSIAGAWCQVFAFVGDAIISGELPRLALGGSMYEGERRSQALLMQQVPLTITVALPSALGGWLVLTGNLFYLYGLGLPLAVLAKLPWRNGYRLGKRQRRRTDPQINPGLGHPQVYGCC